MIAPRGFSFSYTKASGGVVSVANAARSSWTPTSEEAGARQAALRDFELGVEIMNRPMNEFNGRSIVEEINVNQQAFNTYVPPRSDDPDDEWRAQTVRPITRNKLISIAAHVTSTLIAPTVFAQNKYDEEDEGAAEVMGDLFEWVISNSQYERMFVRSVIQALVEPATFIHTGYSNITRIERSQDSNSGEWKQVEVPDEVLSGFFFNIVPCQEIMISNIYEPDIQKQRFVIRSRYIDFLQALEIYRSSPNLSYVKPGMMTVYDAQTQCFYDVPDQETEGKNLVQEVTCYYRTLDLELTFLNGIIISSATQPMRRKDKLVPFAKSGYEYINNGQFFYYKSAAAKIGPDQELVDALYNVIMDGALLATMPPMALFGQQGGLSSPVVIPGMVTSFENPNAKLENIGPRTDIRAGLEAIGLVEKSISESSQDDLRSGVGNNAGARTARETLVLEKNAQVALGMFGMMVRFLVEDVGKLMVNDVLQSLTVAEVDKITNGLKYRSFVIHDKTDKGRTVSKQIKFDQNLLGKENMSSDDYLKASNDLLSQEGGPKGGKKIALVNPQVFREIKYRVTVSADEMQPRSKALEKALNLEAYDRAIQNPYIDPQSVTRDFLLEVYKPGHSDDYMKKDSQIEQMQQMANDPNAAAKAGFDPNKPQQKGVNTNLVSQMTGGNSLGVASSSMD